MSNYDSEFQFYCNRRAEHSRNIILSSNLIKAVKEINIDDSIWDVTWKGYTFSVRPFLCSAFSFMGIDELFNHLCDDIVYSDEDFYLKLSSMTKEDYDGMFSEDENYVFESILYQFNSPIPCIVRYLVGAWTPLIVKKLMTYIVKEFFDVYNDDSACVHFFDKSICNTQAFSYYLTFYWLMQKSKKLRLILSKELKTIALGKRLEELCPETSIHYKYISGVLSAKDLSDKYCTTCEDELEIIVKEFYNLFTSDASEYPVGENLIAFRECTRCTRVNYVFGDFELIMSCSYISMGFFGRNDDYCLKFKSEIDDLRKANDCLTLDNKSLKKNLKEITRERNSLSNEITSLKKKLDTSTYDNKISKLEDELSDLKKNFAELEIELSQRDEKISEYKRTIRSQIKEIKSLNASLDVSNNEDLNISEESDEIEQVSLEDMCVFLRSKKLGVFGGFDAGNIQEKFKEYGLSVRHVVNDTTFDVGDLDCAIVLTTNILHKTLQKLKSQYDGRYVYVNGTNIDNMILSAYNKLINVE